MSGLELLLLGATSYMAFDGQQKAAEAQGKQIEIKKRKEKKLQQNLLEEQLSSHRARVGAMGINSGSDDNIQENMAKKSHLSTSYLNQAANSAQDNLSKSYQDKLMNAGMGLVTKMIK